jgi:heterodisulfide reductase subunit C1
MRKIPDEALAEIKNIFDLTGGTERFEAIEKFSKDKAEEMNIELTDELMNDYVKHIYTYNSKQEQANEK